MACELSPFASRTVTRHVARGVVGVAMVAVAIGWAGDWPILAVVALLLALVAFRGCPMCWTIGLFEVLVHRVRTVRR
jgi:hypothetical protein